MDAHSLKSTMVVIAVIPTLVFGALGLLACGTVGAGCQSEEAQQFQDLSFAIFIPSFLIFILLLFLPHKLFGATESDS